MPFVNDNTAALLKYWEIKNDFNHSSLLAHVKKRFTTEKEAHEALDGLLQWLACHLQPSEAKTPMVMLRGPVALMFDIMVEYGQYEGFCCRYFGTQIKRNNLNTELHSDLVNEDAVHFMLVRIQSAFGKNCVSALSEWIAESQPQILFFTTNDKPFEEVTYLLPREETNRTGISA